jgi:hypothetical protein
MKACCQHFLVISIQAYIFEEEGAGCAAFLVNNDQKNNATVEFRNITFELLPKSISILPDCENIIFNTAQVHKSTTIILSFLSLDFQVSWTNLCLTSKKKILAFPAAWMIIFVLYMYHDR